MLSEDKFREEIAAHCHEQWAGWMCYQFEKSTKNLDGTMTIPKWAVDRWSRQACATYDGLSEEEKDNDRREADEFIQLFRTNIRRCISR